MIDRDHSTDDSAEAQRIIGSMIDEALSHEGFLLDSRIIEIPEYMEAELDARTINVRKSNLHIARPMTDEYTHRSTFVMGREGSHMSLLEVAAPRDADIEVPLGAHEDCMVELRDILEQGERLGIIDRQRVIETLAENAQANADMIDKFSAALPLEDPELLQRILDHGDIHDQISITPDDPSAYNEETQAWLRAFEANQLRKTALMSREIAATTHYSKIVMHQVIDSSAVRDLDLTSAWTLQRLMDRVVDLP